MSAGLLSQLESYGEVFAAAVDARAQEETMRTDDTVVPIDQTETPNRATPWKPIAAALGIAAMFVAAVIGITAIQIRKAWRWPADTSFTSQSQTLARSAARSPTPKTLVNRSRPCAPVCCCCLCRSCCGKQSRAEDVAAGFRAGL